MKKKAEQRMRENDKYANQLADRSEYSERFQKYSAETYAVRNSATVSRSLSTSLYDAGQKDVPARARTSVRLPQTKDVLADVYENMLVRARRAPRTFYYLGKIPTNGALDVYSMKDFETLTPVREPTLAKEVSHENSTEN
jgi:hypothetical protein